MPTLTLERALLVLLVAIAAWQAREQHQTTRHVNQLSTGMTELTEAMAKLEVQRQELSADLGRAREVMSALESARASGAALPAGASGRTRGGAAAGVEGGVDLATSEGRAARRAREPGQGALNRLYDAADRMAADEGWDPATYDAVAGIFEDSMAGMLDLWSGMQAGDVQTPEARDHALAMRDDAQARLLEVLGPDGVERLKGYLRRRGPPAAP